MPNQNSDDLFFGTSGPKSGAPIAIVGESWGSEERAALRPFVGSSGRLLNEMLREAGYNREDCFVTNLLPAQPENNETWRFFDPKKGNSNAPLRGLHPKPEVLVGLSALNNQLAAVRPSVILAIGNYALWALTDHAKVGNAKDRKGGSTGINAPSGIMNWRGSMTYHRDNAGLLSYSPEPRTPVLPLLHPAAIMRQWGLRAPTSHDLRTRIKQAIDDDWRPARPPVLLAPPTWRDIQDYFNDLSDHLDSGRLLWLSVDIETKFSRFITCIGLSCDPDLAIAIPFVVPQTYEAYWDLGRETEILRRLRQVFLHPNCRLIGQNFLYDMQFLFESPGVRLRVAHDTMLAQHLIFPGTPKDLGYLSSLYCRHHWYWKEDSKEWDEKGDLTTHLRYNAMDALRTREIALEQQKVLYQLDLQPQWEYLLQTNDLAWEMYERGIRVNFEARGRLMVDILTAAGTVTEWFDRLFPQELTAPEFNTPTPWYRSPTQLKAVLGSWGLKIPLNRKTGGMSTGKESMAELRKTYPGFRPLFDRILALRSLRVFQTHFLSRRTVSHDGRLHSSFNPAGAYTFRWSSSTNAHGQGANMQNVPKKLRQILGDDDDNNDDEDGDDLE